MCIPLIAQVVNIENDMAEVKLIEGETVRVSPALFPDASPGQYVLLDRGLIIELIEPEEATKMLEFYSELENMWAEEDARVGI